MKTLNYEELCKLERLIGDAREYTRIVEILSDVLIWSTAHEDGQLTRPIDAEDEGALMVAIQDAGNAARKVYKYFHAAIGAE